MERRDFIKMSIIGATTSIIMPKIALANKASNDKYNPSLFLGGFVFTANNLGRFAGKEFGHLPEIKKDGNSLLVKTNHPMASYEHYIIKHILFDENFKFIEETMFTPGKDEAISKHDISGHSEKINVLSVCNKHDSWLSSIEI